MRKRSSFGILGTSLLILCALTGLSAKQRGKKSAKPISVSELAWPSEATSLETPDAGVTGVRAEADKLLLLVENRGYFITMPILNLAGSTREATFGSLAAAVRRTIDPSVGNGSWRGVALADHQIVLLDGLNLRVASVSAEDYKFVGVHTLPWDVIRPPRDRGGEPTHIETEGLRNNFRHALTQIPDVKLTGLVAIPKQHVGEHNYLVASRVAKYPILTMRCESGDAAQCRLDRACFTSGLADITPGSVSGIAYSVKRDLVLLGERRRQRILLYKFHSCMSVERVGAINLPAKMQQISNVSVDADDRLWVTTDAADDYLNASLYFWNAKEW